MRLTRTVIGISTAIVLLGAVGGVVLSRVATAHHKEQLRREALHEYMTKVGPPFRELTSHWRAEEFEDAYNSAVALQPMLAADPPARARSFNDQAQKVVADVIQVGEGRHRLANDLSVALAGVKSSTGSDDDVHRTLRAVQNAQDAVADAKDAVAAAQGPIDENKRYSIRTPGRDRELAEDQARLASAQRWLARMQRELEDAKKEYSNAQAAAKAGPSATLDPTADYGGYAADDLKTALPDAERLLANLEMADKV